MSLNQFRSNKKTIHQTVFLSMTKRKKMVVAEERRDECNQKVFKPTSITRLETFLKSPRIFRWNTNFNLWKSSKIR